MSFLLALLFQTTLFASAWLLEFIYLSFFQEVIHKLLLTLRPNKWSSADTNKVNVVKLIHSFRMLCGHQQETLHLRIEGS